MASVKRSPVKKKPAKRTTSSSRAKPKTRPSGKATKKKTPPKSKSKFREKRIVETGKRAKIEREPNGKKHPGGQQRIKLSIVCKAIQDTRGNLTLAAKNLGISRTALYTGYVMQYDEVKQLVNDVREGFVDLLEDKLYEAADNGEAWSVCFGLKCLGKSRGYIEKLLLGGTLGSDVKITVQGSKKSKVQDGIN